MDYDALDAAVARYFEDPALVQGAKTRAVVVIYKVQTSWPHRALVHCELGQLHVRPGPHAKGQIMSWGRSKSPPGHAPCLMFALQVPGGR